jgi:hypothetical protein
MTSATITTCTRILTLLALLLSLAVISPAAAHADLTYTPRNSHGDPIPNGVKVYLSRSCHDRSSGSCSENIGCYGHIGENEWSKRFTSGALYDGSGYGGLVNRQYTVRIGTGLTNNNIANSDGWGSDLHIPVHSNASPWACSGGNMGSFGTLGLWYSSKGLDIAEIFVDTIGASSPGTGDETRRRTDLGELRYTNAPAGYLEAGYHTSSTEMNWMHDFESWDWRLGWAVDWCAGYPRHGQGDTRSALCYWL